MLNKSTAVSSLWHGEEWKRDFKKVSPAKLREMGIKTSSLGVVEKMEDLKKSPPNIVIAEAYSDVNFVQNFFKDSQKLVKKQKYVMGLGVFQQLQFETKSGKRLLKPSKIQFKNVYRAFHGQDLTNKKLLVFRTGGFGDLLFIQPNLIYLKQKYPSCKIYFACGPQYRPMVETWDFLEEVLLLPFPVKYLFDADYHVIFEGVIERCKEARYKNSFNLFSEWMGLNLPDELLLPRQHPKEDKLESCREVLRSWGVKEKDFIITQLRASSPIRTPRPEFFAKIIDRLTDLGHNVVITDVPRQSDSVEKFLTMVKNRDKVFNFCKHSETVDNTIALIKLSKLVISTDSALIHFSASLDTPCLGIYGPFPGFIRMKTYPKADWIEGKRQCLPCFLHGSNPCPQAGPDTYSPCYDAIDHDEIIAKVEKLIQ